MSEAGKKSYLTKEGLARLKAELKELKRLRLQKAKEAESEDEVKFIDVRINELAGTLKSYEIITLPTNGKQDTVGLGATVEVELLESGRISQFTIVGSLETDPLFGRISNESPAGKAVLGKRIGDVVTVQAKIPIRYKIRKIIYGNKKMTKEA